MKIGNISLDADEESILKLNPKFAVLKCLEREEIERDIELGTAKLRYELGRLELEKRKEEIELESSGRKKRKIDENVELSNDTDINEAAERQVYCPKTKRFDYTKRRVTDLKENVKVYLPDPVEEKFECELEMVRQIMLEEFDKYVNSINKERVEKGHIDGADEKQRNQEWANLTTMEKRGLSKLQKRIKSDDIVILKTDKSGKFAIMPKLAYL